MTDFGFKFTLKVKMSRYNDKEDVFEDIETYEKTISGKDYLEILEKHFERWKK